MVVGNIYIVNKSVWNMIIVKFVGGLGNQMFQYAAAIVLGKKTNQEVKVDALYYKDKSQRRHRFEYRPYALSLFDRIVEASPSEIMKHTFPRVVNKYLYHLLRRLKIDRNVYSEDEAFTDTSLQKIRKEGAYISGFFQKYSLLQDYIDDIKSIYTFTDALPASHKEIARQIDQEKDSICIVFRRGDYVGHPFLDIVDLEFYERALKCLPHGHIFAFSDDLQWVRENFAPEGYKITYVDQKYTGPMGGYYLQLMMLCDNFIIPNSTYPYWAALLSHHSAKKKVVAPAMWYKGQPEGTVNEILPKEWIAI